MRGSTRKRGTTWTAYWSQEDPATGERRQRSKGGFKRQKDAEAYLDDLLSQVRAGTYIEPSKQTLHEFLTVEWLPAIAGTVKPGTLDTYRAVIRQYIEPSEIGRVPLANLSPGHCNAVYASMEARGLSVNTRRNVHTVLSRALSDAVRWERLRRNPAKLASPPRQDRRRATAWTPTELRMFLAHVEHDRLHALWRLAATTGMRRGELAGLQWLTVDLEGKRLRIERQILKTRAVGTPKSSRSNRTIALDDQTAEALRRHRDTQDLEKQLAGDAYRDQDMVFATELGDPVNPMLLTRSFSRHRRDAGIPTGTLHILRHTAATLALTANPPVPLHVVAARLGDKPETLLAVYAHLLPKSDQIAADAVAAVIAGLD